MMLNGIAQYWYTHCNSWRSHSTDGHAELQKKINLQENKNKVEIKDSKAVGSISVVSKDVYQEFFSLGLRDRQQQKYKYLKIRSAQGDALHNNVDRKTKIIVYNITGDVLCPLA